MAVLVSVALQQLHPVSLGAIVRKAAQVERRSKEQPVRRDAQVEVGREVHDER